MSSYVARSFAHLLGTPGFSDKLLKDHFGLYEGYVTNTNKLLTHFAASRAQEPPTAEFSELKRRFGWEFNGMRLHEIYFDTLARNPKGSAAGDLKIQIGADFGSFESWSHEFKSTGEMRGIGWVAVQWDPVGKRLFNNWIDEHDRGALAGCPILLLMDVFEHAYMPDYGTKRVDYIEAFFKAIDWDRVAGRFEFARRMSPEMTGTLAK